MIKIRKAADRGHFDHGWLDTWHTFSFADYHDPEHMGFSTLRVLNDDRVEPARGFPTHGHRDMEILTYVLDGALEHKDSLGTGSVIRPGDVQRMSAGTGVMHSEFNPSRAEPVHLLQIWILPAKKGIAPSYEEKFFADDEKRNRLRLIASSDGRDESVTLHTNADVLAALIDDGSEVRHELRPGRRAWVQVARGSVTLNGQDLRESDGAAVEGEPLLRIAAKKPSEVLVFDLP